MEPPQNKNRKIWYIIAIFVALAIIAFCIVFAIVVMIQISHIKDELEILKKSNVNDPNSGQSKLISDLIDVVNVLSLRHNETISILGERFLDFNNRISNTSTALSSNIETVRVNSVDFESLYSVQDDLTSRLDETNGTISLLGLNLATAHQRVFNLTRMVVELAGFTNSDILPSLTLTTEQNASCGQCTFTSNFASVTDGVHLIKPFGYINNGTLLTPLIDLNRGDILLGNNETLKGLLDSINTDQQIFSDVMSGFLGNIASINNSMIASDALISQLLDSVNTLTRIVQDSNIPAINTYIYSENITNIPLPQHLDAFFLNNPGSQPSLSCNADFSVSHSQPDIALNAFSTTINGFLNFKLGNRIAGDSFALKSLSAPLEFDVFNNIRLPSNYFDLFNLTSTNYNSFQANLWGAPSNIFSGNFTFGSDQLKFVNSPIQGDFRIVRVNNFNSRPKLQIFFPNNDFGEYILIAADKFIYQFTISFLSNLE